VNEIENKKIGWIDPKSWSRVELLDRALLL
jgi:hypothetical protein